MPSHLKNIVICRYFSLSGLLDLLGNSTLKFKKISLFEDKAEGIPQYTEIIDSLKNSAKYVSPEYSCERKENILKTIGNYYASCWVMNDTESYLMWKNYTNYYEGILLFSTVEKLIDSLEIKSFETEDRNILNWFFGEIDYGHKAKYDSEHMRAFSKTKYFEAEKEFRLVLYRHPASNEEAVSSKLLNTDFIVNIICAPGASRHFYDLIRQIVIDHSIGPHIDKEPDIKQNSRVVLEDFLRTENHS